MKTIKIELPDDVFDRLKVYSDRFFKGCFRGDGSPCGFEEMAALMLGEESRGERCLSGIARAQREAFMAAPLAYREALPPVVVPGPWIENTNKRKPRK
jgi:hypothetical protein